jgi:hypothetical protein
MPIRVQVSCLSTRATLSERPSLLNLLLISQSHQDISGGEFKFCKRRKASSTTVEVLNFAADPESRTEASAWENLLQNSAIRPAVQFNPTAQEAFAK